MPDKLNKDRHKPGYINRYHTENYHQFYLRVRKDSGIMEALKLACQKTGMSQNEYICEALLDKLVRDDCIPWE